MATAKAPPPPPKKTVTEADKQAASERIASALGAGSGVSPDTGAVSASAVKAKAEERVAANPPASKPAPPASKKAPPPPAAQAPVGEERDIHVTVNDFSASVSDALGAITLAVGEVGGDVKNMVAAVKKLGDALKKENADLREGLATIIESNTKIHQRLESSQANGEARIEVRSINHGHVRVLFTALPNEPEWIDEWAAANSEKYDVPAEELARLAKEFGFTHDYGPEAGGVAVCSEYEEQMGV